MGKGKKICIASHRENPWSAQVWIRQIFSCKYTIPTFTS